MKIMWESTDETKIKWEYTGRTKLKWDFHELNENNVGPLLTLKNRCFAGFSLFSPVPCAGFFFVEAVFPQRKPLA